MVDLVLAASDESGSSGFSAIWIVTFLFYWVPTVVALIRNVPNKGSVIVINLFLGWTCIGWVVALAMSVRSKPPAQPPMPYPPNMYPPQPYPPDAYPPSPSS